MINNVDNQTTIVVAMGASPTSVSYAVYTLIEQITPTRFAIQGDIVPDRTLPQPTIKELLTPRVLRTAEGLFHPGTVSVRGLQPFHDFAEGPDWWDGDEYKLLLDQMAKLKMNLIGLHTYGGAVAEGPSS